MSPKTNRGIAWTKDEVNALLDTWAEQDIQDQLAERLHNMCIYDKISIKLKDMGYDRTGEQCREKIKKLRRDYRNVVKSNYAPALARRLIGVYDKVHALFGKRKADPETQNEPDNTEESTTESNPELTDTEATTQMDNLATSTSANSPNSSLNSVSEDVDSTATNINQTKTEEASNESSFENTSVTSPGQPNNSNNRQRVIHHIFSDSTRKVLSKEIEIGKARYILIEKQRQETISKQTELFKSLLELVAQRKGFAVDLHV